MRIQILSQEDIDNTLKHCKKYQPVAKGIDLESLEDTFLINNFDIDSALSMLEGLGVLDEQGFPCELYQHSGCFEIVKVEYRKNAEEKIIYRNETYLTPRGIMFLTLILEKMGCPQLDERSFI